MEPGDADTMSPSYVPHRWIATGLTYANHCLVVFLELQCSVPPHELVHHDDCWNAFCPEPESSRNNFGLGSRALHGRLHFGHA